MPTPTDQKKLFAIASAQQGFFTAKQAAILALALIGSYALWKGVGYLRARAS
ncbi:MAG: hypothetical protein AB7F31_01055 [Parachlamydiales bacterium]